MNGKRATVVFADDDVSVGRLASELLEASYDIIATASDGLDALRCILELRPDFAVLDISMPRMDGIAVARKLRAASCPSKIVFLTLIDDEDYVGVARDIANGYVLKRRLSTDLIVALEAAAAGKFFSSIE